jgi:hypothetical protein
MKSLKTTVMEALLMRAELYRVPILSLNLSNQVLSINLQLLSYQQYLIAQ